jgi:hypothetical protein
MRRSARRAPMAAVASASTPVAWSTPSQCMRLFVRGVTVRTAGRVAAVVGTILSAVNQGSTIVAGDATWVTWIRVAVNYCVPFCVASIGFLAACRVPAANPVSDPAISISDTVEPQSAPSSPTVWPRDP